MVISRVKPKFPVAVFLGVSAVLTAVASWAGIFPRTWVERGYSNYIFPTISHIASFMSDAVGFSWLDFWLVVSAVILVLGIRSGNWRLLLGWVSIAYLVFFWGWGLNYHRLPIETRLQLKGVLVKGVPAPTPEEFNQFVRSTADALNQRWPVIANRGPGAVDPVVMAQAASDRVRRVIFLLDGRDWKAASRIKHSYLSDWWLRAAGIDGLFNPFAHEPILAGGISSFELPFLMSHELAHVHGIADEGDANFVAFLAAAESGDPEFQYSAAFEMWLHLGGPAEMLDAGPKRDLNLFYDRVRAQEVPQATRLQSAILNSHLKANGVAEGVRSYSRFVALAIATQSHWEDFR